MLSTTDSAINFSSYFVMGPVAIGESTGSATATLNDRPCFASGASVVLCSDEGCPVVVAATYDPGSKEITFSPDPVMDAGSRVQVQALANLTGFWLSLTLKPCPPASIGVGCATPSGVAVDRPVPIEFVGQPLSINNVTVGNILGLVSDAEGRTLIQVDQPITVTRKGVAIAGGGNPITRINGPYATGYQARFSARIPKVCGGYEIRLNRGWQGDGECIPDTIDFSVLLRSGELVN